MLLILLLLQLLPPLRFRALLVGHLEAQEVPPQGRLAGDVDDGAGNGSGVKAGWFGFSEDTSEVFGGNKLYGLCTFVKTLTLALPCLFLHPPLHCHYTHTPSHLMERVKWKE